MLSLAHRRATPGLLHLMETSGRRRTLLRLAALVDLHPGMPGAIRLTKGSFADQTGRRWNACRAGPAPQLGI